MTGILRVSAMARIAESLLACLDRSSLVRPWTAKAATPQLSIILHNSSVSSKFGSSLTLQVTGMLRFSTREVRISLTFSGCVSSAAPIPPFSEKSFGHPILTSNPATSFSLNKKFMRKIKFKQTAVKIVLKKWYLGEHNFCWPLFLNLHLPKIFFLTIRLKKVSPEQIIETNQLKASVTYTNDLFRTQNLHLIKIPPISHQTLFPMASFIHLYYSIL